MNERRAARPLDFPSHIVDEDINDVSQGMARLFPNFSTQHVAGDRCIFVPHQILEAVFSWQEQIKDDAVEGAAERETKPQFTVGCRGHLVALILQTALQCAEDLSLIFDDQETRHAAPPSLLCQARITPQMPRALKSVNPESKIATGSAAEDM